jgi:hypothetical protein
MRHTSITNYLNSLRLEICNVFLNYSPPELFRNIAIGFLKESHF